MTDRLIITKGPNHPRKIIGKENFLEMASEAIGYSTYPHSLDVADRISIALDIWDVLSK